MEPTKFGINYSVNLNSDDFKSTVEHILTNYEIDEIIETGSFNGLGSTSIFAQTGKYVFTIECNFNNYATATKNLANYDNVCVIHGLSLDREFLIQTLLNEDFKSDTVYDSSYPKTFYMREISQQVVLEDALRVFSDNDRKQLVFLDSAGGVGYAEFLKFMSFNRINNKILMMDDINHIKHSRSIEWLTNNGYNVRISENKRFAWTDFSKL